MTEYYSNDTKKAETSQGLDNRQGKKLREGSVEVGSTALQGHHQNLKPQGTGAESRGQPGVTKPWSATTKAVLKFTVETEQGSQREGVPTRPVGGEPNPNPETKQEPPGVEAIKSKNAQERELQVKSG